MNCGICKAYLAYSRGVPYKKGEISHCTGCLVRNKNCAFIKRDCEKVGKKHIRFCYECAGMPCKNLSKIDDYYKARFGMSMVENQKVMREKGWMNSSKVKLKSTSAQTAGTQFQRIMENAMHAAIKQAHRNDPIPS